MQPKILSPSGTRRRMAQSMNEPYKIARQRLYLGRGCLVSVSVKWSVGRVHFGGLRVVRLSRVYREKSSRMSRATSAHSLTTRWISLGGMRAPVAATRVLLLPAGAFSRPCIRSARSIPTEPERALAKARRPSAEARLVTLRLQTGGGIQLKPASTFEKPNYLRSGGQRRCRPIALSHVHGDHIAALCRGRSQLCHLEEELPAEGAHSPRVRGEGLVLGVLRMRQGALVTGGGVGGPRRAMWAARFG